MLQKARVSAVNRQNERLCDNGEPGRIRTFDPLIKSQLLYHLSYGPTGVSGTLSVVFRQYPNLPHRPFWCCVLIAREAHEMA